MKTRHKWTITLDSNGDVIDICTNCGLKKRVHIFYTRSMNKRKKCLEYFIDGIWQMIHSQDDKMKCRLGE